MSPGAVDFQGRVLATGDFLATWAVELAVHQLDIALELDVEPPTAGPLRLARATVEALVGAQLPASWSDSTAVLRGAGRLRRDARHPARAGSVVARLPVIG